MALLTQACLVPTHVVLLVQSVNAALPSLVAAFLELAGGVISVSIKPWILQPGLAFPTAHIFLLLFLMSHLSSQSLPVSASSLVQHTF